MSKGGGGNNIDIFLRLKPVNRPSTKLAWDPIESIVSFNVPKTEDSGYVNNQRELYEFKFNGIFGPDAKQVRISSNFCQFPPPSFPHPYPFI